MRWAVNSRLAERRPNLPDQRDWPRGEFAQQRSHPYRTGLDKTRLCVDGKGMLYAFCQEFGVPHRRCGKLLVAMNAGEIDKLAALKAQAVRPPGHNSAI
jgi:hypothetical protein